MTDTVNDQLVEIVKTVPCPRCEAKVNEDCTSVTGGKAGLHASRMEPVYRSYGLGYADGLVKSEPITAPGDVDTQEMAAIEDDG